MAGPNTFGAEDDLAALQAWLQRHAMSPRTYRAYGHALEVFYLWCVWVRKRALSSLVEAALHAFRAFKQSGAHDPKDQCLQTHFATSECLLHLEKTLG